MDPQSSTHERESGSGQVLSRRNIVRGAVGVAAAGARGAVLTAHRLIGMAAAGHDRRTRGGGPGGRGLTDAATIAVDASLGNDFRVTIAGNRTMGTPANPADGQKITFQVTQGTAGSYTLSWASGYEFSAGLPQPTLSTTAGDTDLLCFIYNSAKSAWLLAAFLNGFTGSTVSPSPTPTSPPRHLYPRRRHDDVNHVAAAIGNLPAVPDHRRAGHRGLLLRAVRGRRRVRGHHRRMLAGRLLVVGVRVGPVDVPAEVLPVADLQRPAGQRGAGQRRDVGNADRRGVEFRAAGDKAADRLSAPRTSPQPGSATVSPTPTASSAAVSPTRPGS